MSHETLSLCMTASYAGRTVACPGFDWKESVRKFVKLSTVAMTGFGMAETPLLTCSVELLCSEIPRVHTQNECETAANILPGMLGKKETNNRK